jgi:hypothetical protein
MRPFELFFMCILTASTKKAAVSCDAAARIPDEVCGSHRMAKILPYDALLNTSRENEFRVICLYIGSKRLQLNWLVTAANQAEKSWFPLNKERRAAFRQTPKKPCFKPKTPLPPCLCAVGNNGD